MNDTVSEVEKHFRKLIKNKSPQERLIMGSSMFDASKEIVQSSIKSQNPGINKKDLAIATFDRIYGREFDENTRKKIINHLAKKSF